MTASFQIECRTFTFQVCDRFRDRPFGDLEAVRNLSNATSFGLRFHDQV